VVLSKQAHLSYIIMMADITDVDASFKMFFFYSFPTK
jgi:hypothetical protein